MDLTGIDRCPLPCHGTDKTVSYRRTSGYKSDESDKSAKSALFHTDLTPKFFVPVGPWAESWRVSPQSFLYVVPTWHFARDTLDVRVYRRPIVQQVVAQSQPEPSPASKPRPRSESEILDRTLPIQGLDLVSGSLTGKS